MFKKILLCKKLILFVLIIKLNFIKSLSIINKLNDEEPCLRDCKNNELPKICYYKFEIETYYSMSKACYNCPFNKTDCFRKDCIPVDGIPRSIVTVNRKMPGPAIQVTFFYYMLN